MGLFDSLKNSLAGSAKSAINSAISGAKSNVSSSISSTISKSVNSAADTIKSNINKAVNNTTKSFKFSKLPETLDELKALPEAKLTDYFASAALAVLVLNVWAKDEAVGIQMMDFLNGPNEITPMEQQFVRDQFMDDRKYIVRSYLKGATPENSYTPDVPYEISVTENPYSKDNYAEGYVTLWIASNGSDSPRNINLRTKKSTGEWFVNSYKGLLTDVRIPKDKDAWA